LRQRYPALPPALLRALAQRHGTRALAVLADAHSPADLGEDFGAELTERELRYLQRDEWATSAEDVLWRRTKCGLSMTREACARVGEYLGR
jgi:glycerol-3-phosphate dehydrogenase